MSVKDGFGPGTHGCHEALHMTSFLIDAIENELVDHDAIKDRPEWCQLAEKARDALGDLYQAIGKVHISA